MYIVLKKNSEEANCRAADVMPFMPKVAFMLLSSRRTLDTRGTYLRIARGGVDATHSATLRARRSPRVQSLSDCSVEVEPKGLASSGRLWLHAAGFFARR